jgi:hypothetical protein
MIFVKYLFFTLDWSILFLDDVFLACRTNGLAHYSHSINIVAIRERNVVNEKKKKRLRGKKEKHTKWSLLVCFDIVFR